MGCCSIIIIIFIAIAVAFVYVLAAFVMFDIIFLVLAIAGMVRTINANNMRPSKMICPNCKSKEVKLSTRKSGTDTNAYMHRFGFYMSDTINYQRIAECYICGFVWDYYTLADIKAERLKACGLMIVSAVLFVISMVLTIGIARI